MAGCLSAPQIKKPGARGAQANADEPRGPRLSPQSSTRGRAITYARYTLHTSVGVGLRGQNAIPHRKVQSLIQCGQIHSIVAYKKKLTGANYLLEYSGTATRMRFRHCTVLRLL